MSRTRDINFARVESFAFLTREVQAVHKDLLVFEARAEERFKTVSDRFDRLESKVDAVDRKLDLKVDGLAKALPGILSDALREVFRTQSK